MTQMRRLCSLTINKRLAAVGSSVPEYAVLFRLSEDTEVAQHELAYDAALDPAAVSRLVRNMSRDGTVTTRVDPTDKRQRFVKLTPKGRNLERTLAPIVDAALQPLLGGLSSAEEQQFLKLLRKSYAVAEAAAAAQDGAVRSSATDEVDAESGRSRRPTRGSSKAS